MLPPDFSNEPTNSLDPLNKHLFESFVKSTSNGQGRGNQECGSALYNPACSRNFDLDVKYLKLFQAYSFHKIQKIKETKCIFLFQKANQNFALGHFIEILAPRHTHFCVYSFVREK
jgi:hypothetical protein